MGLLKEEFITILEPFPWRKSVPQGGRQIRKLRFDFWPATSIDSTEGTSHYHSHYRRYSQEEFARKGQLLLSLTRQKIWISDARNVLRRIMYKWLTCFDLKATTATQLMGQLPEVRVKPFKSFTNTGVDYAGLFYVKQGAKRSKTILKCYIALFVCLSTKAIHLDLVPELTT